MPSSLLFVAFYVGPLHEPRLKDVLFGVAAPPAAAPPEGVARLEGPPGSPLDPRSLPDEEAAREQIENRDVYAALVVRPDGRTDTLLVASGGGRGLTGALTALTATLDEAQGCNFRTVDVA